MHPKASKSRKNASSISSYGLRRSGCSTNPSKKVQWANDPETLRIREVEDRVKAEKEAQERRLEELTRKVLHMEQEARRREEREARERQEREEARQGEEQAALVRQQQEELERRRLQMQKEAEDRQLREQEELARQ